MSRLRLKVLVFTFFTSTKVLALPVQKYAEEVARTQEGILPQLLFLSFFFFYLGAEGAAKLGAKVAVCAYVTPSLKGISV